MSINLKEEDRYVVNRDEGLMAVDFGGYRSLAEKEGAGMAGTGAPMAAAEEAKAAMFLEEEADEKEASHADAVPTAVIRRTLAHNKSASQEATVSRLRVARAPRRRKLRWRPLLCSSN
ncbi:hypothetical protein B296_00035742 [Ensete ventricosum]|uniref:Uncharacterized protein n=1 Tax=Ensete ventricosum TaxID=4639 RepID=A0A426YDQ3_ENSVE|nr:hypothetical protein B296_00035742 [Ensete ventricosum]